MHCMVPESGILARLVMSKDVTGAHIGHDFDMVSDRNDSRVKQAGTTAKCLDPFVVLGAQIYQAWGMVKNCV